MNQFTEEYFLRGPQSGLSNYENYHFMPKETQAYADCLIKHLELYGRESLLDIGCARGYFVKTMVDLGYKAKGHDISEWAIRHCHPDVMDEVSTHCDYEPLSVDWVHSKDCLEHWYEDDLRVKLPSILSMARKGCFFIVPLVAVWGGKYLYPADNQDKTHRIRFTLETWMRLFEECATKANGEFSVHGSYHLKGLKQASVDYPHSTGFFTIKRFP